MIIENKCYRCNMVIPEGEPFVKITIYKETKKNKILDPQTADWIQSYCMKCADKKNFSEAHVPDRLIDIPKGKFICCLCGRTIPDDELMFNIAWTKAKMDGSAVLPDETDILRTYCKECVKTKNLLNTTFPDKKPSK